MPSQMIVHCIVRASANENKHAMSDYCTLHCLSLSEGETACHLLH